MKDKPHLAEQIQPTLSTLENEWEVLEVATKEKGEKLFDANRGTLYQQSIEDVDSWVAELEAQMVQAETVQVKICILYIELIGNGFFYVCLSISVHYQIAIASCSESP